MKLSFSDQYRSQYLAALKAEGISPRQVRDAAVVIVFIITVAVVLVLYAVWYS